MNWLALGLTLLSSTAFAATDGYHLDMHFLLNGQAVSAPQLLVRAGEKASITQRTDTKESFVEVIVQEGTKQGRKGIQMNFSVGLIAKDGQRVIKGKPQIFARENEPAQITVADDEGDELSLSVVVSRKAL